MSLDKLSPEEQQFAAEHHRLLLSFIRSYRIDEDMYGALALRYLKAVHRYLSTKKLRKYRFSTILWLNLRSELSHELRKTSRLPVYVPLDEETYPDRNGEEMEYYELWREMEKALNRRELEVLYHRTQGCSYLEIAKACNLTIKAVGGRLYRLKKKISRL